VLVASFESEGSVGRYHAKLKQRACEKAGVLFELQTLPWNETDSYLRAIGLALIFVSSFKKEGLMDTIVESLNKDPSVDGIFLQTPFPFRLSPLDRTIAVSPHKDVDAHSIESLGNILSRGTCNQWNEVTSADAPAVVTAALEVGLDLKFETFYSQREIALF
jgi:5,10-methylene-tetrahydrofolate dehydrogenase/methenyl tetrahydrofolate cyclohydrolase